MAETVEYTSDDKSKAASASATQATHSPELRAVSPTSTTISHEGIRTPNCDEESQPPVWGQHRIIEEVEADVKTINIHIQINVPSTFKLPSFRSPRCQWKRRTEGCDPRRRSRFLAATFGILYLSFIVCGGAAWGIQDSERMTTVCHFPLIVSTFSPFFDCFATVRTIYMIRRYKDGDRPKTRYALLLFVHVILFAFHLTVLIFGTVWAGEYCPYYWRAGKKAIVGLILYSSSTMILMKAILFIFVIKNGGLRRNIRESVAQFPSMVKKEVEYERLTSACDEDANQIGSVRPSTEGQIFLS